MTVQTFEAFLVWARRLPVTTLLNLCVDLTGDLKAGLMLSRTVFWLALVQRRRSDASALPVLKDARRWLVRADADWWAETRLSVHEARAARLLMEHQGLIVCRTWRHLSVPVTHVSVEEEAFMDCFLRLTAISEEARSAARATGFRSGRPAAKRPGSKPTSGNRRSEVAAEAVELGGLESPESPAEQCLPNLRYYENHKDEIVEIVITELPGGSLRDYEIGNNRIMKSVITGLPENERRDGENGEVADGLTVIDAPSSDVSVSFPGDLPGLDLTGAGASGVAPSPACPEVPVVASSLPTHDPLATMAVLLPNLGGSKKLAALMAERPPGLAHASCTRADWPALISPERAADLVTLARQDLVKHPWTAISDLLDVEIGGVPQKTQTQIAPANGGANILLRPGASLTPPGDALTATDAFLGPWEVRARPGVEVQVMAVSASGDVTLQGGTVIRVADLVTRYRRGPSLGRADD